MNLPFTTVLLLCAVSTGGWFFFPNLLHWVSSGRRPARLENLNTRRTGVVIIISAAALLWSPNLAVTIVAILVLSQSLGLHLRWLFQGRFS